MGRVMQGKALAVCDLKNNEMVEVPMQYTRQRELAEVVQFNPHRPSAELQLIGCLCQLFERHPLE
ncbi:hypothetical protein D3C76_719500 [compost metagenome]